MSKDLIERLEKWAIWCHENNIKSEVQWTMNEAADELEISRACELEIKREAERQISSLRAEIERLRAALERIATRDYNETAQEFARKALGGSDG